jgi:primosomal protein N' (replication factor Y)
VLLGSATPSLESWHHSRPGREGGRYQRLAMPSRIGEQARLPLVRRVDMNHQPRRAVFSRRRCWRPSSNASPRGEQAWCS